MLTLIYFVLILGVVVFIHELGHFIFAKRAGVHVYEFSIGMGPRLLKFNRKKKVKDKNGKIKKVDDETDYCLRLFPIGGFVQMAGEEVEADEKIPVEKRLYSKKWHQRFMVMVAGVMNNFILAFIVLLIIGWTNTVTLDSVYVTNSLVKDLNDGDKIIEVNGRKTSNYDKLSLELTVESESSFPITVVDKDGNEKEVTIHPTKLGEDGLIYGYDYGFVVSSAYDEEKEKSVLIVSDSKVKGLKDKEEIIAIDGKEVENHLQLVELIKDKDEEITLTTIDSKGKIKDTKIEITENEDETLGGYSYGFNITGTAEKGFLTGIKYAFLKFGRTVSQMFWTVWYLITGRISLDLLSGPIGIYKVVGQAQALGFSSILSLVALLNINVGFINILPLPAFDGGHALFLIIEKIKGSPINPKVENIIHNIFFMLLMLLMVYVTFNDILRLF